MHRDEIDISTPLPMNNVNSRLMNCHIYGKNLINANIVKGAAIMNLISYQYIAKFSLLDI